jgi:hypothetical protein
MSAAPPRRASRPASQPVRGPGRVGVLAADRPLRRRRRAPHSFQALMRPAVRVPGGVVQQRRALSARDRTRACSPRAARSHPVAGRTRRTWPAARCRRAGALHRCLPARAPGRKLKRRRVALGRRERASVSPSTDDLARRSGAHQLPGGARRRRSDAAHVHQLRRTARSSADAQCSPGAATTSAARGSGHRIRSAKEKTALQRGFSSPLTDSNRRPLPYHGSALPTELRGRGASG